MRLSMTKTEQLQRIMEAYRATHGFEPASLRTVGEWAVDQGLYKLPPQAAAARCAEELGEALRTEYLTAPDGTRVRVMHAVPSPQGQLWDHIATASRDFFEKSVAMRRVGIVADVKQLKRDVDFYNGLHSDEPPLQLSFNFTNDLADAGLLEVEPRRLGQVAGDAATVDLSSPAPVDRSTTRRTRRPSRVPVRLEFLQPPTR